MRIKYLSLAVRDLRDIRVYISSNNPDAASRVGSRLKELINTLSKLPNLGKPGRVFGTRELNTPKIGKTNYVVAYRVMEKEIQILRVLPRMRDIDTILEESLEEES